MRFFIQSSVLVLSTCVSLIAVIQTCQAQTEQALLFLPFQVIEADTASVQSLETLLRLELERSSVYSIIDKSLTPTEQCRSVECAVALGKSASADYVVYGQFSPLGVKTICLYTLVDVRKGEKVFSGDVSEYAMQDFYASIPLIASSINNRRAEQRVRSSNVIHRSRYKSDRDSLVIGLGFGQLMRTNGYYTTSTPQPDTVDTEFIFDALVSLHKQNYTLDALIGIRHGLALSLGASYLPVNGSITPYIGGGIGYHLQLDEDVFYGENDIQISGFLLLARTGMKFLINSSMRAFADLGYMYTLNSRDDQALTLTIGLTGITIF